MKQNGFCEKSRAAEPELGILPGAGAMGIWEVAPAPDPFFDAHGFAK